MHLMHKIAENNINSRLTETLTQFISLFFLVQNRLQFVAQSSREFDKKTSFHDHQMAFFFTFYSFFFNSFL